jgi:hypothetical protein
LLNGAVNLLEVTNAGASVSGVARTQEAWNGDGGQKPNQGNDYHDFHEGKSPEVVRAA